jgi:hypothetical protein
MHVRRDLLMPSQILDTQYFRLFRPRPPPAFLLFLSKNILLLLCFLGVFSFEKHILSFS